MKSYFDLLNQDLQEHIFDIKNKMNVFDNMKMMMHKKKHMQQFQFCLYQMDNKYREDYPCHYYENISSFRDSDSSYRYNDFEELYDENDKSVDGFSDQLLYCSKEIIELKNKYPPIIIKDLFNCIADFDLQEAKQIERTRRFLYLIN